VKPLWLLCAAAIPFLLVTAQEAAPVGFEQWTTASLRKHEKKMYEDATADPRPLCS
jgi:hypothetical protein